MSFPAELHNAGPGAWLGPHLPDQPHNAALGVRQVAGTRGYNVHSGTLSEMALQPSYEIGLRQRQGLQALQEPTASGRFPSDSI